MPRRRGGEARAPRKKRAERERPRDKGPLEVLTGRERRENESTRRNLLGNFCRRRRSLLTRRMEETRGPRARFFQAEEFTAGRSLKTARQEDFISSNYSPDSRPRTQNPRAARGAVQFVTRAYLFNCSLPAPFYLRRIIKRSQLRWTAAPIGIDFLGNGGLSRPSVSRANKQRRKIGRARINPAGPRARSGQRLHLQYFNCARRRAAENVITTSMP